MAAPEPTRSAPRCSTAPARTSNRLSLPALVDGAVSGLLRNNIYTFSAKAGDNFLLRLLKTDTTTLFRPRIDIYDSIGTQLQFLSTNNLDRLNFAITADGTYSLVVTDSYDNTQSGAYTFSLLRLDQPANAVSLSCGAPAPGGFPRSLSAGVYTYTASAGDSFTLRMLPGTGSPQPSLEIYDSQRQLRRPDAHGHFPQRRRRETGGGRVYGGRPGYEHVAQSGDLHAGSDAHHECLLGSGGAGRHNRRSGIVHQSDGGLQHPGDKWRCPRVAQRVDDLGFCRPDGTLRARWRTPGCRCLRYLAKGLRDRNLHGAGGCGGGAHGRRI